MNVSAPPRDLRRRLAAYLELLHPAPIGFVLLAATGFTTIAASGHPAAGRLAPFLAGLLLTQLAISLHNDYCDRELDASAKPWRAIPAGLLAPAAALAWCGLLLIAGLLIELLDGPVAALLVAACTGAAFLYNARLKRSAWTWLPFWFALPTLAVCSFAVAGRADLRLAGAYVIGAPLAVSIYIADTLADVESDSAHGVASLAARLGPGRSRLACWSGLGLSLVLALSLTLNASLTLASLACYAASAGLLALAIAFELCGKRRLHWVCVMAGGISVGLGWLWGLAS